MHLSFHGANRDVTGSCHLLKAKDDNGKEHRLLFDCGMFQGAVFAEERNKEKFAFDPASVEYVFVTHAHVDHTGRLPILIEYGYKGPIILTQPSFGLSKLVLEDAFNIMKENMERNGEPVLYSKEDLDKAFERMQTVGYHEQIEVAPGITVMFHDAGHILGSAFISVDAEGKRIVFSGDIGNDGVPILPDTEEISKADFVVCESTYGHVLHEDRPLRRKMLKDCMNETLSKKGVLMIPAFSIERTQELLYELNEILLHELKTRVPIYLDSPMAIKATELYRSNKNYLKFDADIFSDPDRDFFSFPNLHETLRIDESKTINFAKAPKIIIAGAGMMTGGRIMHHLLHNLDNPKNTVLIIGYQGSGTLGRKIYENAKQVMIFGQPVEVKAKVKAIGSFSAHGDQAKLTRWLQPEFGDIPKKIFLTHGEPETKEIFATHLRHELGAEVVIPEYQSEHEL